VKIQTNPDVLEKCFWAITNLAKNDDLRKRFAQLDVLPSLVQHLRDFSSSSIPIRKHLLKALINLLAESNALISSNQTSLHLNI
jgi:hypothetical protein